ncbi:hypothetical protein OIT44_02315 [Weissella ceti]|uniref:Mub B2-like domain-containing protein n=1 Tax=Weissella ceti TaxID=759620 RepID=A0ABT3E3B6_9LACO|nr:hypothetical protein [Weissella ceti]MCW0952904.1 hypothetical protein [Weissella ceti]QVK11451.1 hypothetical protein KHQ31_04330 [Weissella ceti]
MNNKLRLVSKLVITLCMVICFGLQIVLTKTEANTSEMQNMLFREQLKPQVENVGDSVSIYGEAVSQIVAPKDKNLEMNVDKNGDEPLNGYLINHITTEEHMVRENRILSQLSDTKEEPRSNWPYIPIWIIDVNTNKRVLTTEYRLQLNGGSYSLDVVAKRYIPQGYTFVKFANVAGYAKPDSGRNNTPCEVYVTPKLITKQRTYQRTIKYHTPAGVTDPKTQVQTVNQTINVDSITGQESLKSPIGSFSSVTSPTVTNYQPDKTNVPAQKLTINTPVNQEVNVNYTATSRVENRTYKRTISYLGPSGMKTPPDKVQTVTQKVRVTPATGKTSLESPIQTFSSVPTPSIPNYQANVSSIPAQTLTSNTSLTQTLFVTYTPISRVEYRDYTRTIKFQGPSSMNIPSDIVQTIKQKVIATPATGKTELASPIQTFSEINIPQVDGYLPDRSDIPAQRLSSGIPRSQEIVVTYNLTETNETRTYERVVKFQDTDGKQLLPDVKQSVEQDVRVKPAIGEVTLTDPIREFDEVQVPAVNGFNPDKTKISAQTLQNDTPLKQEIIVTYSRIVNIVTKEYKRTIQYQGPSGMKVPPTQVQSVKQSVKIVPSLGTTTLLEPIQSFGEVSSPEIPGYLADKTHVPTEKLTDKTPINQTVQVNYKENKFMHLIAPSEISFGEVSLGSDEYFGRKNQRAQSITGELAVSSLNVPNWKVSLSLDKASVPAALVINNVTVELNESKTIYQSNMANSFSDKTVLLNQENKDSLALKLRNKTISSELKDKVQTFGLTWSLQSVPV